MKGSEDPRDFPAPFRPGPATEMYDAMDRHELDVLIREHQSEIYRYLRYLGAGPAEAEDLVQDTFLSAYTQSRTPESEDGRLWAAWLRGIARNHLLMHFRRRRTARVLAGSETLKQSEEIWKDEFLREGDGFDYVEALRKCLEGISGRPREIVALFYKDNKSRAEIAKTVGLSEDGIKSMLRRIRDSLGACVKRRLAVEASP